MGNTNKTKPDMNPLNKYSSKIKRIYIPLPNFTYNRNEGDQTQSNHSRYSHYIGRQTESDKLESWLKRDSLNSNNKHRYRGSYLITGYRGMGKSSFVEKVLSKVTANSNKRVNSFIEKVLSKATANSNKRTNSFVEKVLSKVTANSNKWVYRFLIFVSSFFTLSPFLGFLFYFVSVLHPWYSYIAGVFWGLTAACILLGIITSIYRLFWQKKKNYVLTANLNLGGEIRSERDVLSHIVNALKKTFQKYLKNEYNVRRRTSFIRVLNSSILIVISIFLSNMYPILITTPDSSLRDSYLHYNRIDTLPDRAQVAPYRHTSMVIMIQNGSNSMAAKALGNSFKIKNEGNSIAIRGMDKSVALVLLNMLYCTLIMIVVGFVFSISYVYIRKYLGIPIPSFRRINRELNDLCAHIDASIEKGGNVEVSGATFSMAKLGMSRKRSYNVASIREIEQEVVKIIEDISFRSIDLIFVLDELDKCTSSAPEEKVDNDIALPEFEYENRGFKSKKGHVLRMLAQLKFFITTANAKFIFISGRELYDAYLADVSDREFSISSIFNGVINIDSFFSCDSRTNDVTKMTEMFLCKILLGSENALPHTKDLTLDEEKEEYTLLKYKQHIARHHQNYKVRREDYLSKLCKFKHFLKEVSSYSVENNNPLSPQYKKIIKLIDKEYERSQKTSWDLKICTQLLEQDSGIILRPETSDTTNANFLEFKNNIASQFKDTELLEHIDQAWEITIAEKESWEDELEKVIVFLKQFVTYLTFLSNGAPKKLITHFESYVITKELYQSQIKDEREHEKICFEGNQESDYYLAFGYYDQQRVGFMHYMSYPMFQNIISPSSEYGDKLLISSSFLLGHIYKFHNGGFSWRNIEYTPELIEGNRTPELREFIDSLVSYFEQIHLTQITTGLYNFKFPLSLSEEISVFSKKSEQISAIFNFSRDDSKAVKKYFASMIDYHRRDQTSSSIVVANLHQSLGDLFLASQDYIEAINQFRIAKDIIISQFNTANKENKDSAPPLVVHLIRVMLKLGLVFEKRKTIDSAYLVYSELVNILISFRNFDESKFGLKFKMEKDPEHWSGAKVLIYNKEATYTTPDQLQFHKNTHPRYIDDRDNLSIKFWMYNDELIGNMAHHLTPEKSQLISRLSIYEDLRLAFMPILAKLFAVEKQNVCGITKQNIAIAESEFRHLFLLTNHKEKNMLSADFFRKLGDILYYKNSNFDSDGKSMLEMFEIWGYGNIKGDIFEYCYHNGITKDIAKKIIDGISKFAVETDDLRKFADSASIFLRERNIKTRRTRVSKYINEKFVKNNSNKPEMAIIPTNIENFIKSDFFNISSNILHKMATISGCAEKRMGGNVKITPCYACKYYNRSLTILSSSTSLNETTKSKAAEFLIAIKKDDFFKKMSSRKMDLSQIAMSLDALGDTLLSCSDKQDVITPKFIHNIVTYYDPNTENTKLLTLFKENYSHIEKVLLYYFAASEYYYKAGDNNDANECTVKIFNVLSTYIHNFDLIGLPKYKRYCSKAPLAMIINGRVGFMKVLRKKLKKLLVESYANKDFYNLFEMDDLKDKGSDKDSKGKPSQIKLANTSIVPDIEEAIFAYYEIVFGLASKGYDVEDMKKLCSKMYRSPLMSNVRLESLSYNRVLSLNMKSKLNQYVYYKLFNPGKPFNPTKLFNPGKQFNPTKLFNPGKQFNPRKLDVLSNCDYSKIFNNIDKKSTLLQEAAEYGLQGAKTNIEVLKFLISDTIFCLSNIIDFLTPAFRTTLFTNSFCGNIYMHLLEWHMIKECCESTLNEADKASFTDYFENTMDDYTKKLLKKTYLGKMAINHYKKAIEINSEGKSYQEFISGFNILDDDLQNNTSHFYLALERYRINLKVIDERIVKIRKFAKRTHPYDHQRTCDKIKDSKCFNGEKYLE